jgi:hypothetical protein
MRRLIARLDARAVSAVVAIAVLFTLYAITLINLAAELAG